MVRIYQMLSRVECIMIIMESASYFGDNLQVNCPSQEPEIRALLLSEVQKQSCVSPQVASELQIQTISPLHVFNYGLDTYREIRDVEMRTKPYDGEPEGNFRGPVDPWKFDAKTPEPFGSDSYVRIDVKGSDRVGPCGSCAATGVVSCGFCSGTGFTKCHSCSGSGKKTKVTYVNNERKEELENCSSCTGLGRKSCSPCKSIGRVKCHHCHGRTKLLSWKSVVIRWETVKDSYSTDRGQLNDKLGNMEGETFITQKVTTPSNPQPLSLEMDRSIASEAERMISARLAEEGDGRRIKVHQFTQSITLTPVVYVFYEWKDQSGHFFILGSRNPMVYFPDGWPGKGCCCCKCSIL